MRSRALLIATPLVALTLSLTSCGNGHGLLGPDNVGQMNSDDGVQYGALWHECGKPGDRSDAELLADGHTWVVNKHATVSDHADSGHQVKLRVNKKTGKLEILGFTHGAKAGTDGSFEPEGEHRVVAMKVSSLLVPWESRSDRLPMQCSSPSPTPTKSKHATSSPSSGSGFGSSGGSGSSATKTPTKTVKTTRPTAKSTKKSSSGGGTSKKH